MVVVDREPDVIWASQTWGTLIEEGWLHCEIQQRFWNPLVPIEEFEGDEEDSNTHTEYWLVVIDTDDNRAEVPHPKREHVGKVMAEAVAKLREVRKERYGA